MVMHTLALLAHMALCKLTDGDVIIHFRCGNGSAVTRKYSRTRAVFYESRYLRKRLEEQRRGASANGRKHETLEVVLECDPEVFEAAAQLIDVPMDSKVPEDVAFCTLDLEKTLDIRDGKRKGMFYRGAAKATSSSDKLSHEIESRKSHPDIETYILEVLWARVGEYVIMTDLEGKRVTPGTVNMCVGAIEEISILKAVMRKKVLGILRWFADIANLQGLCLSGCKLDTNAVECVGAMKSLRRLNMHKCRIEPGLLRYIQGLASLEELDVSWNRLNEEDISTISQLRGLTKLDIRHCKIEPGIIGSLGVLKSVRELSIAFNSLNEDDLRGIGKIDELQT